MATAPPISTLTSSADAFKYSLPTIRQLHRQLDTSLDEKNARLRTLVGGSYRQLLGTAETIVNMRKDIEVVEYKLERVADGCGKGVVRKKIRGLERLGPQLDVTETTPDLSRQAKLTVLDGCVVTVRKLLRRKTVAGLETEMTKGRSLVTAAKVLVLYRLLLKSVDCTDQSGPRVIDLRETYAILRRRLSNVIERTLQRNSNDRDDLAEALGAYSLTASAGARDILRHFLHVRGGAIALGFEEEGFHSGTHKSDYTIIKALELYTTTILDVQALVPKKLSESLQRLKRKALLQDSSVKELPLLRLDMAEKWFGDEILYFTPYIQHDDLEGSIAVEMLIGWGKRASEVLIQGLKGTLDNVGDFKTVVDLRTQVLEMWIREGGKAKGFDSSVMLDDLREVFNHRLVELIETRIQKLHLVGSEVEAAVVGGKTIMTSQHTGLWKHEVLEMELKNGGAEFKSAIVSHVHGRDEAVSRVVNSFETWRRLVDELLETIAQIKKQTWDDDLENLEDDLSLEDRNEILSAEDPAMLQKRVDRSLKQSFYDLHDKLATLSSTYRDTESNGAASIILLRIIREVRSDLPATVDLLPFGLSIIPELQRTLASSVSSEPIELFGKAIRKKYKSTGRALWEGTPPLPVYPSPSLFKLLHNVTTAMASAGDDLWSSAAVRTLQAILIDGTGKSWSEALATLTAGTNGSSNDQRPNSKTLQEPEDEANAKHGIEQEANVRLNGDAIEGEGLETSLQHEIITQWTFDIQVLRRYLEHPPRGESETALFSLAEDLKRRSGLADSCLTRMQQSSQDYWKRTSLLFGLLSYN